MPKTSWKIKHRQGSPEEWSNEVAQLEACIDGHRRDRDKYEERIAQLEAELESYKGSFILYDEAQTRATQLWQERTGETILPDSCKLYIWLLEQLQQAQAERDALVSALV